MADKKISALTGASTPLAGTEVLPIVQSGATVKVANNDLRPKQIQSNATSGVLQVAGPASAATRVMTTPDANFTVARVDAAQSFTGDQTLGTGNLVIGTSGKGIQGTTTNNSASAGVVGEYVSSTVGSGSSVALTSPTAADVTSISLTAGDWDVAGIVGFGGKSGTSVVEFVGANAGTTSGGISAALGIQVLMNGSTQLSTVADMTAALPVYRYSLASTTTVYLVARASYTTGSIGAFGTISARRIR